MMKFKEGMLTFPKSEICVHKLLFLSVVLFIVKHDSVLFIVKHDSVTLRGGHKFKVSGYCI
jgi:hypothetical protein